MKPVDSFFSGLRGAFHPDDDAGVVLLVLLAAALVGVLIWFVRRRRRQATAAVEEWRRFVAQHHLTINDVEVLEALAAVAGQSPLAIGSRLEAFEKATAAALQNQAPTLLVRENDFFTRLRNLRHALGFANLPDHFPLLTTRELLPGTTVELRGAPASIIEVTEAYWSINSPTDLPVGAGAVVEGAVIRAHDARYVLTCRLLAAKPFDHGRVLVLSHDEAPARAQLREFVRVDAQGTVRFRPVPLPGTPPPAKGAAADSIGSLVDVSLGGMALHVASVWPEGTPVVVAFEFGGEAFQGIGAVVLDCRVVAPSEPGAAGEQLLRLTFRLFSAGDEQRLAAAITAHTARPVMAES
ncbi:MAG: hypothetical protein QOI66_2996 [Myxococcales bacterium]|nr:hypothetical protein [Myxococcales bacterium]